MAVGSSLTNAAIIGTNKYPSVSVVESARTTPSVATRKDLKVTLIKKVGEVLVSSSSRAQYAETTIVRIALGSASAAVVSSSGSVIRFCPCAATDTVAQEFILVPVLLLRLREGRQPSSLQRLTIPMWSSLSLNASHLPGVSDGRTPAE